MPRRRVCSHVEHFQPFNRGRIVDLREAGWTYRRITAHVRNNVSVTCHCFHQWSVEHSHTRILGFGRPRSTDVRQYRRIVQAAVVARTPSRNEIRVHITPAMSPRTTGNRLLAAGLRLRVLVARLRLTPRHGQAWLLWCRESVDWRVEWRSVVFSDDNRFCLYASDGRTRVRRRSGERHPRSAFAHDTQAPSQAS